jgi:hypothetical protein
MEEGGGRRRWCPGHRLVHRRPGPFTAASLRRPQGMSNYRSSGSRSMVVVVVVVVVVVGGVVVVVLVVKFVNTSRMDWKNMCA